jgi:hypothetical protein
MHQNGHCFQKSSLKNTHHSICEGDFDQLMYHSLARKLSYHHTQTNVIVST